jgi:hypothetical protein
VELQSIEADYLDGKQPFMKFVAFPNALPAAIDGEEESLSRVQVRSSPAAAAFGHKWVSILTS